MLFMISMFQSLAHISQSYDDCRSLVVKVFVILCGVFCVLPAVAEEPSAFTFVTYNVENLFDCRHDTLKNDQEFLPDGDRRWTWKRYRKKVNDIARVLHEIGEPNETTVDYKKFHIPDVIVLCEVENDSVIVSLTRRSLLRSAGYRYVITHSQDHRGVDVSILYNPLTFRPDTSFSIRVDSLRGLSPTRDILYIKGTTRAGEQLHVFALHAPSRSSGEMKTRPYRMLVSNTVAHHVDSLLTDDPSANIIVAGDFNDYSYNESLKNLSERLCHISKDAKGYNENRTHVHGTYYFQGEWGSLDHILVSPSIASKVTQCYIFDRDWLLELDAQGVLKPKRTYRGPMYNGGVSDHLPLVLKIEK